MYAVIAGQPGPARDIHNWVSKAENQSIKPLPSRLLKQNHGPELGPQLWKRYAYATKVRCISLRCNSCLRLKAPIAIGPSRKSLRLSAFKSNGQKDDSGGKSSSSSKSLKKSIGLSYAPPESESISVKAHSIPAYPSDTEPSSGSLAILNLFKSWLTLLHMPSSSSRQKAVGENLDDEENISTEVVSGTPDLMIQRNEKTRIMTAAWRYFMSLNSTVKIPMLIFIPSYLAVNLMYGSEVAKDLYPLWILGPLIVALYIKIFHTIWALYVYSFKQSVKILKNIPSFCQVSYGFVSSGQLNEHVRRRLVQPLLDIKNMDFKEALIRMVERFSNWAAEKYIDYVESIWPFYCRTIRFLKRAHLI